MCDIARDRASSLAVRYDPQRLEGFSDPLRLAFVRIVDNLAQEPQEYKSQSTRDPRHPGVFTYIHADSRLEITYSIDGEVLHIIHVQVSVVGRRPTIRPPTVFVSYSHHDERWLKELRLFLDMLGEDRKLRVWYDELIPAGAEWEKEIETQLEQADVALLLVTQRFLRSDFVRKRELPYILEARRNKRLELLWVAVEDSMVDRTDLGKIEAVNDPSKPLRTLPAAQRDSLYRKIAEEVEKAVDRMTLSPDLAAA
jgi:hypothetical protein